MNPKINCIDYMNKISFGISIAFAYSIPALRVQDKKLLKRLYRLIHWHRTRLRKLWQNLSSKDYSGRNSNHQRAAV